MRYTVALLTVAMLCTSPAVCPAQEAREAESRLKEYDTTQHAGEATTGRSSDTDASDDQVDMLFIGSSYLAAAGGQQHLVPAFLRLENWKIRVGTRMGPGASAVKQYYHDRGEIPATAQALLERLKEREGADSEAYRNRLAAQQGMADKAKGRLTEVLDVGGWDYVVLDGGRGIGSEYHRCVDGIVTQIRKKNPDAKIYLYSTWVGQDRPDEQEAATIGSIEAALRNGVTHIPAGEAMHAAHKGRPKLQVFRTEKDSHPGLHGGYLLACTVYTAITGKSPVGLPEAIVVPTSYDFKDESDPDKKEAEFRLNADNARFLQEVAWETRQRNLKRVESVKQRNRQEP